MKIYFTNHLLQFPMLVYTTYKQNFEADYVTEVLLLIVFRIKKINKLLIQNLDIYYYFIKFNIIIYK